MVEFYAGSVHNVKAYVAGNGSAQCNFNVKVLATTKPAKPSCPADVTEGYEAGCSLPDFLAGTADVAPTCRRRDTLADVRVSPVVFKCSDKTAAQWSYRSSTGTRYNLDCEDFNSGFPLPLRSDVPLGMVEEEFICSGGIDQYQTGSPQSGLTPANSCCACGGGDATRGPAFTTPATQTPLVAGSTQVLPNFNTRPLEPRMWNGDRHPLNFREYRHEYEVFYYRVDRRTREYSEPCIQTVTYLDDTPPTPPNCNLLSSSFNVGGVCSFRLPTPGALATDDCTPRDRIRTSVVLKRDGKEVPVPRNQLITGAGNYEAEYIYTDRAGNSASCTKSFTADDETSPRVVGSDNDPTVRLYQAIDTMLLDRDGWRSSSINRFPTTGAMDTITCSATMQSEPICVNPCEKPADVECRIRGGTVQVRFINADGSPYSVPRGNNDPSVVVSVVGTVTRTLGCFSQRDAALSGNKIQLDPSYFKDCKPTALYPFAVDNCDSGEIKPKHLAWLRTSDGQWVDIGLDAEIYGDRMYRATYSDTAGNDNRVCYYQINANDPRTPETPCDDFALVTAFDVTQCMRGVDAPAKKWYEEEFAPKAAFLTEGTCRNIDLSSTVLTPRVNNFGAGVVSAQYFDDLGFHVEDCHALVNDVVGAPLITTPPSKVIRLSADKCDYSYQANAEGVDVSRCGISGTIVHPSIFQVLFREQQRFGFGGIDTLTDPDFKFEITKPGMMGVFFQAGIQPNGPAPTVFGSAYQLIEFIDDSAPSMTCPMPAGSKKVGDKIVITAKVTECAYAVPDLVASTVATDACGYVDVFQKGAVEATMEYNGKPENDFSVFAVDEFGNVASCDYSVIVEVEAPKFSCPTNVLSLDGYFHYEADPITCKAKIDRFFDLSSFTYVLPPNSCPLDATGRFSGVLPSQSKLEIDADESGEAVVVSIANEVGVVGTCEVKVRAEEYTAPTINCPATIEVEIENKGGCGVTILDYGKKLLADGAITDNCSDNLSTYQSIAPKRYSLAEIQDVSFISIDVYDEFGNLNTCRSTLKYVHSQKPTIKCPVVAPLIADDTSCTDYMPNLTGQTIAKDYCGLPLEIEQSIIEGTTLGEGDHVVTISTEDKFGNKNECDTTVSVKDVSGPLMSCPATIRKATDANDCQYTAENFIPSVVLDACDDSSVVTSQSVVAGVDKFLPRDEPYLVTITAVDTKGTATTCDIDLYVYDPTPIEIECPSSASQGQCGGSLLDYTVESQGFKLKNACSSLNVVVTQDPPANSVIDIDLDSVEVTATYGSRSLSCTIAIDVVDDVVPTVQCPEVRYTANGSCKATIGRILPRTAEDSCSGGVLTFTQTNLGKVIDDDDSVVITATDKDGNSASCVSEVYLDDHTDPTVTCSPRDTVTVYKATGCATTLPSFNELYVNSRNDNCDDDLTLTQTIDQPTLSVWEKTVVTTVVTDDAGNSATCPTTVTAVPEPLTIKCDSNANTPPIVVQGEWVNDQCVALSGFNAISEVELETGCPTSVTQTPAADVKPIVSQDYTVKYLQRSPSTTAGQQIETCVVPVKVQCPEPVVDNTRIAQCARWWRKSKLCNLYGCTYIKQGRVCRPNENMRVLEANQIDCPLMNKNACRKDFSVKKVCKWKKNRCIYK